MLIIGAKGFAREILQICIQNNINDLKFYDDINDNIHGKLYNCFTIFKSLNEVKFYFRKNDTRFTLGIGNPYKRFELYKKISEIGGEFTSTISPNITIGDFEINIDMGCNILDGVRISNGVTIGKGCLIYYNSVITHDCVIGDFVEISPSSNILGEVQIGDFTHIGSNSTILPKVKIGKNVIVAAGSVVREDIPDNCLVAGVPAKIKKTLMR